MAKSRKAKVLLTERALADLEQIEAYSTGRWGKSQAAKYLDAFDRLLSLIESEPGLLLPVLKIDSLLTHSVESHVIVCTAWNKDILVLTIVHASRDLPAQLDRLLPNLNAEVEMMKKRLLKP